MSILPRPGNHCTESAPVSQASQAARSRRRDRLGLARPPRLETRARAAHLRHLASVEDVDYRAHHGIDSTLFLELSSCDWIRSRRNLVIIGPCGVGERWLACALGQKACQEDLSVPCYGVPRLLAALGVARGDDR